MFSHKIKVSSPVNSSSAMPPIPNEFLYLFSRLPMLKKVLIPTTAAACGAAGYVYSQRPEDSENKAESISSKLDQYKKKESSQISSALSDAPEIKENNTAADVQKKRVDQKTQSSR